MTSTELVNPLESSVLLNGVVPSLRGDIVNGHFTSNDGKLIEGWEVAVAAIGGMIEADFSNERIVLICTNEHFGISAHFSGNEKYVRNLILGAIYTLRDSERRRAAERDERPKIVWCEPDYPRILDEVERLFGALKLGIYRNDSRLVHAYRYDKDSEPDEF